MLERERLIRLPRSGPRNAKPQFAKLLTRVSPNAQTGFDFGGQIFQPGRVVPENMLRPPGFPVTPLLLECTGVYGGGSGHNRGECHYLLWRLDGTHWVELGRAQSRSWEWSVDLAPIAKRALDANRTEALAEVMTDLSRIEKRITTTLDRVLLTLDSADQRRLLATIHDELASRFASAAGAF